MKTLWKIFLLLLIFKQGFAHDKFIIQSIPKCGTHFLQQIITELTEMPTFHNADTMQEKLIEADKGEKILRIAAPFSPNFAQMISNKGYKMICIYRDPRDAFISLVVYMRSFKGKGVKRDFFEVVPNFDNLSFDEQLLSVMTAPEPHRNYFHFYFARINWHFLPIAYGVKYESLVGSKGGGSDQLQLKEVLNIAEFINFPLTLEGGKEVASSIYCSRGIEMVEGKEFVKGRVGNWKKFMQPIHKEIFKRKFGNLLIKLGYEKNLHW